MVLTPEQCRGARAMLHITAAELAERAEVGIATVKRFELKWPVQTQTTEALRAALEDAGVEFIDEGATSSGGNVGLRLREK